MFSHSGSGEGFSGTHPTRRAPPLGSSHLPKTPTLGARLSTNECEATRQADHSNFRGITATLHVAMYPDLLHSSSSSLCPHCCVFSKPAWASSGPSQWLSPQKSAQSHLPGVTFAMSPQGTLTKTANPLPIFPTASSILSAPCQLPCGELSAFSP